MPKRVSPSNMMIPLYPCLERKYVHILEDEAEIKGIKLMKLCSHILRNYAKKSQPIEEKKEEMRRRLQKDLDELNIKEQMKRDVIVNKLRSLKGKT